MTKSSETWVKHYPNTETFEIEKTHYILIAIWQAIRISIFTINIDVKTYVMY